MDCFCTNGEKGTERGRIWSERWEWDGKVVGRFRASGVRPAFAKKLKVMGVEIPAGIFERE